MHFSEVFLNVCKANKWACDGDQVEIKLPGGRKQRVFFDCFDYEDREVARLYTIVGTADTLSNPRLRTALSVNFSLAHGALAIRDEYLVMTDTFVAASATEDRVKASVLFIAAIADRYEELIYGTDEH